MSRASRPKKQKKVPLLLLVLLAVACILAAELAVCRVAAPDLFQRITGPVLSAFHTVTTAAGDLGQRVRQALPEKQEAVNQQASDPSIQTDQPAEDPKVTEFVRQGDREVLTGGTVPLVYYNQGEDPWRDAPYGSDPIGGYGCGPTAMAMVVSSLTDQTVDPAQMAAWAVGEGYWAPGSGSYHSLIQGAAWAYGLDVSSWRDFRADRLLEDLSGGSVFVALMGPGHFTTNGHFIVLRGVTMDGRVLVADPNSRQRSLTAWDPQLLLDERSGSTGSGGPMWRFTVAARS